MTQGDRKWLSEIRQALVPLHRTLLEWERSAYERVHGRMTASGLLEAIVSDPQFAWLRPVSELIVLIDQVLDADDEAVTDVSLLVARARELVAPDEAGSPYAQRYHAALQDVPDVVFAHRRVVTVLREGRTPETVH